MKKLIRTAVAVSTLVILTVGIQSNAQEDLKRIRCTCYVEPGTTASGHYTHEGVIAGRKEDLGKVAAIYAINEDGSIGEFLGYYDFYDTGAGMDSDGDGVGDTIRTGKSVDVFKDSMGSARQWIRQHGDYVYIKIIDAQG